MQIESETEFIIFTPKLTAPDAEVDTGKVQYYCARLQLHRASSAVAGHPLS